MRDSIFVVAMMATPHDESELRLLGRNVYDRFMNGFFELSREEEWKVKCLFVRVSVQTITRDPNLDTIGAR